MIQTNRQEKGQKKVSVQGVRKRTDTWGKIGGDERAKAAA